MVEPALKPLPGRYFAGLIPSDAQSPPWRHQQPARWQRQPPVVQGQYLPSPQTLQPVHPMSAAKNAPPDLLWQAVAAVVALRQLLLPGKPRWQYAIPEIRPARQDPKVTDEQVR